MLHYVHELVANVLKSLFAENSLMGAGRLNQNICGLWNQSNELKGVILCTGEENCRVGRSQPS